LLAKLFETLFEKMLASLFGSILANKLRWLNDLEYRDMYR